MEADIVEIYQRIGILVGLCTLAAFAARFIRAFIKRIKDKAVKEAERQTTAEGFYKAFSEHQKECGIEKKALKASIKEDFNGVHRRIDALPATIAALLKD